MTTTGERPSLGAGTSASVVVVGNPAAGSDWSYTLTRASQLLAVKAVLTTDAVVANRAPALTLSDNAAHTLFVADLITVQVASNTITYSWGVGLPSVAALGGRIVNGFPPINMNVGWIVATSTVGLDVNDQWANIVLTFAG